MDSPQPLVPPSLLNSPIRSRPYPSPPALPSAEEAATTRAMAATTSTERFLRKAIDGCWAAVASPRKQPPLQLQPPPLGEARRHLLRRGRWLTAAPQAPLRGCRWRVAALPVLLRGDGPGHQQPPGAPLGGDAESERCQRRAGARVTAGFGSEASVVSPSSSPPPSSPASW